MNRLKLSEAEAFQRMQRASRSKRSSLKEIAAANLQAEELLTPFEESS